MDDDERGRSRRWSDLCHFPRGSLLRTSVCASLVHLGCAGDGTSVQSGTNEEEQLAAQRRTAVCTEFSAQLTRCGGQADQMTTETDLSECLGSLQSVYFGEAFISGFDECMRDLPCAQMENADNICITRTLLALGASSVPQGTEEACIDGGSSACRAAIESIMPGFDSRTTGCLARWTDCGTLVPVAGWKYCLSFLALDSTHTDSAVTCITTSCEDFEACMESAGAFRY